jgi:mevalonate kinase
MQQFYAPGKLLITGEYAVLDGAWALALPTRLGQTLTVTPTQIQNNKPAVYWQSILTS